jgi:glycosyltransferase involved in cell wall biosynthesis
MRVTHCLWAAGFGGIEQQVVDLAIAQRARGMEVSILCGDARGEFLGHLQSTGARVHSLGLRWGGDLLPHKIWRAARLLRHADIAHLHCVTPAILLGAMASGSRTVYTEHGNFAVGRSMRLSEHLTQPFTRWVMNNRMDYITFNSKFTQLEAERVHGLAGVRRGVVYNGVNFAGRGQSTATVPPDMAARLAGKFVVGTASRFKRFKRVDRLVDAFAEFLPGRNAVLLLVGDGEQRAALEAQVQARGIAAHTVFTGYQPDVVPFQQAMDVCAFPSEGEPFGLVAVETMSLGKPTVVFADGRGVAEIVERGDPADVVDSIGGMVNRLAAYYDARRQGGIDGQRFRAAADHFSLAALVENLDGVYGGLLA